MARTQRDRLSFAAMVVGGACVALICGVLVWVLRSPAVPRPRGLITVVEQVVLRDPLGRVIGERCVLQQDARLQPGTVVLADPGEFELFPIYHGFSTYPANSRGVICVTPQEHA